MNEFKDLADRTEFTTKEGTFVEELLCVVCPECGQETIRIVTGKNLTYYIHDETVESYQGYCIVKRGQEFIPDALMYAKAKNVELHDLVISTTVRCW